MPSGSLPTFAHRITSESYRVDRSVLAGDGETLSSGGMTLHTLERRPLDRGRAAGRYIVKTILAPRDEAIDLDATDYGRAVALSNEKRTAKGRPEADARDGPEIRRVRGGSRAGACCCCIPYHRKKPGRFQAPNHWRGREFPRLAAGSRCDTVSTPSQNDTRWHDRSANRAPEQMGTGANSGYGASRLAGRGTSTVAPVRLFAAVRDQDDRISIPSRQLFSTPQKHRIRFHAEGISIVDDRSVKEGLLRLAVTLERPDLQDIFEVLVVDLISVAGWQPNQQISRSSKPFDGSKPGRYAFERAGGA